MGPSPASQVKRQTRRIRCKMCRTELAAREHMLDHGQIGARTPPLSRRSSISEPPVSGAGAEPREAASEEAVGEEAEWDEQSASSSPLDGVLVSSTPSGSLSGKAVLGASGSPSLADLPVSTGPDGTRFIDLAGVTLTPPVTTPRATPAPEPILVNKKCSGYYVEPLAWMAPLLAAGTTAGKITCPSPRCAQKLGNFDWAGVRCGCGVWVTPAFCINRAKVDEVTVLV